MIIGPACDPWWTDGGFEMPLLENHSADTLAVDVYPKVECSDVVRWSCYEDGSVLLLNTENNIRQQVVLHTAPGKSRKVRLAPGELRIIRK